MGVTVKQIGQCVKKVCEFGGDRVKCVPNVLGTFANELETY